MTSSKFRVDKLAPGFDLGAFDCGEYEYNEWLANHASAAASSGSSAVYLLLEREDTGADEKVVGYYAICPTLVVRDEIPKAKQRGLLRSVPGYLLAKLAVDRPLRGDTEKQWGAQLLRDAIERLIAASEAYGGQIIVVDADNPALVGWYESHGFQPTGADDLRLFTKVSTARRYLGDGQSSA